MRPERKWERMIPCHLDLPLNWVDREAEKLTNELNEAKKKILSFESELSTQNQLASQKLETQISQLTQLAEELESERKSTSDLTQKVREYEEQMRVNKDLESSAQGQLE